MFFTVAMVTLVAWFPMNSHVLSMAYYDQYSSENITTTLPLTLVLTALMYSNTFSSSIVYFIFDKNYRVRLSVFRYSIMVRIKNLQEVFELNFSSEIFNFLTNLSAFGQMIFWQHHFFITFNSVNWEMSHLGCYASLVLVQCRIKLLCLKIVFRSFQDAVTWWIILSVCYSSPVGL